MMWYRTPDIRLAFCVEGKNCDLRHYSDTADRVPEDIGKRVRIED
jgi:hypothetical protein